VIDIAIPRRRLKSSENRSLRSCERSAACIRSLAKLSLVTFSVEEPANRLYYCWSHWLIEWSKLYYRKYWKDIRLFCLIVVVNHKLHLIWRWPPITALKISNTSHNPIPLDRWTLLYRQTTIKFCKWPNQVSGSSRPLTLGVVPRGFKYFCDLYYVCYSVWRRQIPTRDLFTIASFLVLIMDARSAMRPCYILPMFFFIFFLCPP